MVVDLLTVGLLVVLEGLLSADNALVMAVMVLRLPRELYARALTYGLVGAFALRIVVTLAATALIRVVWIKALGGAYLLYLVYRHFFGPGESEPHPGGAVDHAPAFWSTVVRVELVNLAFSIDSILVAVAMSPKRWVVLTGGLLGVLAMRLVVSQLIEVMRRYPALVHAAFAIIAWVAVRLLLGYAHDEGWISWEVPQRWSLIVIGVVLAASIPWAVRKK
ncbi:MAG TPA: hypothetical protein VLT86_16340 [Vicinamibacterales bacterium]|nr:hypothetical protein [Vicinamibacterales bacterium]